MKIEYIIRTKEELEFADGLSFENIERKIRGIKYSDIYILTYSLIGENEQNAKSLSYIHEDISEKMNLSVLTNGSAQYYAKSLFPEINDFEYKLRRILRLASSLSTSQDLEKTKETISNLEMTTLGDTYNFLFTDSKFNSKIKSIFKDNQELNSRPISKKQYLSLVETISENTVWNQLIGNMVPILNEKYLEIIDARNDVMHAHNLTLKTFNKHKALFAQANSELENAINNFENPTTKFTGFENFNSILGKAFENYKDSFATFNFENPAATALQRFADELKYNDLFIRWGELAKTAQVFGERIQGLNSGEAGIAARNFGKSLLDFYAVHEKIELEEKSDEVEEEIS